MTLYQAQFFSVGDACEDINFNAYFTDKKKACEWCFLKSCGDMVEYIRLFPSNDYFVGVREWADCDGQFKPVKMHFLTEYVHDLDGNIEPLNWKHLDRDFFTDTLTETL